MIIFLRGRIELLATDGRNKRKRAERKWSGTFSAMLVGFKYGTKGRKIMEDDISWTKFSAGGSVSVLQTTITGVPSQPSAGGRLSLTRR